MTVNTPSATIGDSPELLDIYMDEFARGRFLVTHNPRFPGGKTSRAIEMGELPHPVTCEDAFDRGTENPEVVDDAVWPPLPGEAESDDAVFAASWDPGESMVRGGNR